MVSLGFFTVAGQNDLPFVSSDLDGPNEVQTSLLSFASTAAPATAAGVRAASAWNLPLCEACVSTELFPAAALHAQPRLQLAARGLSDAFATGLSSADRLQGWLAGPQGAGLEGSSCATACAPLPQTANFYAGGFDRPYAPPESRR